MGFYVRNIMKLTNMNAGYSGTPLLKKLGIKEETDIVIINAPEGYLEYLGELPAGTALKNKLAGKLSFLQFFTLKKSELEKKLPLLKKSLISNGQIWISWPKKTSKIPTDVTEDVIRKIALKNGLVDVKVCAIDEVWSGLKLVIRLKDRK